MKNNHKINIDILDFKILFILMINKSIFLHNDIEKYTFNMYLTKNYIYIYKFLYNKNWNPYFQLLHTIFQRIIRRIPIKIPHIPSSTTLYISCWKDVIKYLDVDHESSTNITNLLQNHPWKLINDVSSAMKLLEAWTSSMLKFFLWKTSLFENYLSIGNNIITFQFLAKEN